MKKTLTGMLVIMQLLAVCALFSLVGCEGEQGPEGPTGPEGMAGDNGVAACGTCHNVSTEILAKQIQWAQSTHATGSAYVRGTSASCAPCHTSEGFRMKIANLEVTGIDNPTPQNCRTCHNIHTNFDESDFDLSTTASVELTGSLAAADPTIDIGKGNLCANCHQTRDRSSYGLEVGGPDVEIDSSHWGPHHGVEANVLTGNSGFEIAGSMSYDDSPHASMVSDGCVTCHMAAPGTTTGGHTFYPNTTACKSCHTDISNFDYHGVQTEIKDLLHDLALLLEAEGLVAGEDGEYHPVSGVTTTSAKAGALFNFIMIEIEDGSFGVHNYKYTKALIQNSIEVFD